MKVSFVKGGRITAATYQLSKSDIEQQAFSDFTKYARIYQEKNKKPVQYPIDVDHMAKELWGVEVSYASISQVDGEETLGYFDHKKREIVVDPEICKNDARTTFTVAHEIGHLSLHSFLMTFPKQNSRRKKTDASWRLEWQATQYAIALLSPKQKILDILGELSLCVNGSVQVVDLNIHAKSIQDALGLSRQALEIRLSELGITSLNKRYG